MLPLPSGLKAEPVSWPTGQGKEMPALPGFQGMRSCENQINTAAARGEQHWPCRDSCRTRSLKAKARDSRLGKSLGHVGGDRNEAQ